MKRTLRLGFKVLLCLAVLTAMLPGAAVNNARAVTVGAAYSFGEYPQTRVTVTATLNALNTLTPNSENIVEYNGTRYKKVRFTEYTPYYPGTPSGPDKSYQDDNGYYINTTYWFAIQPIQWRVLAVNGSRLVLLSERIMDAVCYNNQNVAVTWESSSLRAQLNGDFMNTAFTAQERARLVERVSVNANNPVNNTPGGVNTNDTVWLLSYTEVCNTAYGFNSNPSAVDNARIATGTDYAKAMGLFVYNESGVTGNSGWWLRTPGQNEQRVMVANGYGHLYSHDFAVKNFMGIRPAIEIDTAAPAVPQLVPTPQSGCVADHDAGLVYGLAAGIQSLEGFASAPAGYTLETVPTAAGFGTGRTVRLMLGQQVAAEYTVVIFGDVNGDGLIGAADADYLLDVCNYAIVWDPPTDAPYRMAVDLNGDGNVDAVDADLITEAENWTMRINQTTGLAQRV